MERQSSFGSQSSAGSAFTSKSATTKLVDQAEKDNAIEGQTPGLLTALFGALYTLAKEKINDSANVAMLAIWVDFLMIFTLILMPEFPWEVDPNLWVYKVFYYIQVHLPIANTGYQFYLVIFYILVAVLFVSVTICIWVGWCFMNDSFPFLWPIKVARVVVSLFVSMFYIASLNVFLMACACDKHGDSWKHLVFKLDCLSFPHAIHAIVSLTSSTVFFVVAVLLVLGDHELEPMSKSLLAAPHSMCELRSLLCKTVITVADILLKPLPRVQTVLYVISCGLLFYYHARMVPHYVPWINVLRGGLNAVLAWVSLMACILTYTVHWEYDDKGHPHWDLHDYRHAMTTLMAVGVPVSFLAGAGICWGHLVYAWRTALKFKVLPEGVKPRNIHRFLTEFDVEVASRIGRVWDVEGVLDQTALAVAENVLKAGVVMKPTSVFMHIVYSNFLLDVRHNSQSGWNHLEQATKLGPNLSYQFSIFSRKQEHKQQSGGGGGGEEGGAVDLVSYVEFQKNYKSLMVYHKAALVATRDFWRLLTHDRVPLDRLGHSFKRMDEMESKAEATYKMVLDRYPSNAKLLRTYGKFLEAIKNDPWGAARYYAEAERQEELEDNKAADFQLGDDTMVKSSGIISINASGIIQMTNKVLTQMFGYKKGELNGKNVSVLMPAPFSHRHNSFLRSYITTGKASILDTRREVVGLHKDRFVFPVSLQVTQVSGSGVDAVFMGLIKHTDAQHNSIKAWLQPTGTILCADMSFMDHAGWGPQELVGRAFSSLGTDSAELDDLIAQSNSYTQDQLAGGALQLTTSIKHKYADDVPVQIKVEFGGTNAQRILVMCMKPLTETAPMAAFDHKGHCVYANTPLASMLGYTLKVLRTKDITQLMAQPFGVMHLKYLKDAEHMPTKPSPNSCLSSMTSVMLTSNNTPVYVIPTIIPPTPAGVGGLAMLGADGSGSTSSTVAFKVQRSSAARMVDERRLLVGVSAAGTILWASTGTPAELFGLSPDAVIGQGLATVVDIFAEYLSGDSNADMSTALAALVSAATAKPGTSWRVGVGNVKAAEQAKECADDDAADFGRIVVHQASGKQKVKPALMTVALPGDESLPEETTAAGLDVALFIDFWRADMLTAVAEVVEGCTIVRAEPSMGLLFSTTHTQMLHSNLSKWLGLAPGAQLADLMGTKGQKKGGMKSSHMHKAGPVHHLNGLHPDHRPMPVCLQACLRDGNQENRLVLAIKPTKPLMGAPGLLADLIAGEADSGACADRADDASHPQAVPGLALDKVHAAAGASKDLLDTHRGTHRSNLPGSNLVTARLVDIDMAEGPEKAGRAPAHLVASPTGSDRAAEGHHVEGGAGSEGSHQEREMDVSSGSEQEVTVTKRKKHLTEEEMEAALAAKGANKAREWLESGFAFKKGGPALPGAVEEELQGPALLKRAARDSNTDADEEPAGPRVEGNGGKAASEQGSEGQATSNGTAGEGNVSDYGRGKRLRKLLRLLSSKAALQVVIGFRFKVILLVVAICMVHMGAFGALLAFVAKQDVYLSEVAASGEVVDVLHRVAALSVVLEAAQRSYGLQTADIPLYAAELEINYNRLDQLTHGLYLGFSGLRSLDNQQLYALWHDENINTTMFLDATDAGKASAELTSLFAGGSMYIAAAKEVQFAVLHPSEATPLSQSRAWHFLQASGPGTLYGPFMESLDLMVARSIDNATMIQRTLLALLCIEGIAFMIAAVVVLVRLLSSISVHRQALFSVFLAVPQGYLRTLASKSVSIGDDDAEEDEDDKIMQAAEDAKRKKKKQDLADAAREPEADSQWGSVPGGMQALEAKKKSKKAFFADHQGDATVEVATRMGPGGKDTSASGGKGGKPMASSQGLAADRSKLFNGKQLVTSAKSAYQLCWPILLWGVLVLLMYGISYNTLTHEQDTLMYIKLTQKARVAASRVTYFALQLSLDPDLAKRQALQPALADEAEHLSWMYSAALYGTGALHATDGGAHGDFEHSTGCLFALATHKQMLFEVQDCLRHDKSKCLTSNSPFYAVTSNGLDAMMMRLAEEAKQMSVFNSTVLGPDSEGFGFVWEASWYDLHDGLADLNEQFIEENRVLFNQQRAIHIVLVVIMGLGGVAFLLVMLRPFLRHISKESRRCAELLVQLPPDFDVEGMVAATWSVVKQERLLVERSGKTFLETGGVMSNLRAFSQSLMGQRLPQTQEARPRLSAMAQQHEGPLFTPRYSAEGMAGHSKALGDRSRPAPARARAPPTEGFFNEGEAGDDAVEGGRQGMPGSLRHRHVVPGPAGGSPRGRSRRAIVPVDNDLL